jgi:hypothetical protein
LHIGGGVVLGTDVDMKVDEVVLLWALCPVHSGGSVARAGDGVHEMPPFWFSLFLYFNLLSSAKERREKN